MSTPKKKLSITEISQEILSIVQEKHPGKHKLRNKYHVMATTDCERLLLLEIDDTKTVKFVSLNALISDILFYCNEVRRGKYVLLENQAKAIAKTVLLMIEPLEKKPSIIELNEGNDLCFHRVPFHLDLTSSTPLFDEMMSRTSNSMALRCFIGSLLCPTSDRSQYLWLYGSGGNGKGCLLRLLRKIFNGALGSEHEPSKGDRFWTSGLLDKRLVVFPECDDATFPASGLFKTLTGGDPVRIEKKNQAVFTADLDCKFMFLSNERPVLNDSAADRRRAIFCEIGSPKTMVGNFEKMLWLEAPAIIGKCWFQFCEHMVAVGDHTIRVDGGSLDQVTTIIQDTMQAIFDRYFLYTMNTEIPKKGQDYVTGPEMQEALLTSRMYNNKAARNRFLGWLRDRYAIENTTFRNAKNEVIRGYLGIKIRHATPMRHEQKSSNNLFLA